MDLGVPKMVRGIITQGARGLEGSAENRAFVRKYKLAHSSNGKDWTYITDSKTGFAKVEENTHTLSPCFWHKRGPPLSSGPPSLLTHLQLFIAVSQPSLSPRLPLFLLVFVFFILVIFRKNAALLQPRLR